MMLHKNRSRSTGLWKYGFSAPLFILMLIVSAATASSERNKLSIDSDNSLASIEKITALPLPVMMSIGKDKATGFKYDQSTSSAISVPSGSPLVADHTDLKKHIARTIGYTGAAKAENTAGYIQVNFLVKGKKISDVEITKKLHPDLDNQVLEAFKSFNSEISIPDNDYVITVMYLDTSRPVKDQLIEKPSKNVLFAKNYLGEVLALIKKDGTLNAGWDMSRSRPNPVTGNIETIGFDGASAQDKIPEFPGGLKAWQEYLSKNLRYTIEARNNNIQGRVIVSFTVEKDGGIADIKVLRGIGSGLDEEAVRVIARSPNWIPGTKNGVPANITFTAPINFGTVVAENPVVASKSAPSTEAILDFSKVETLPEYPGGMTGWGEYLSRNLKYPEVAKKNKITGRVILEFIVEKDGGLTDIKVLRGIGGGADEEAVRVVKNAPNWKPGILNGQTVRVKYTMPIFFQLSGQ